MNTKSTGTVRHIGDDERRARLARAHRLAPSARADRAEDVARSLVALHGTDPATVYLAVGARLAEPSGTVADVERALYEDRSLVRMHGMRHTVFTFPVELAATVHASTGLAVAAKARAGLLKDIAGGSGGRLTPEWLAEVEASALAALERRGEATVTELAADEPRLREQFTYGRGKSYEAEQTVSSRLMRVLGVEGRVVRGGRSARGPRRSSGGRSRRRIRSCRSPRRRRSCSGCGWGRAGPPRRGTSSGGRGGRSPMYARRSPRWGR